MTTDSAMMRLLKKRTEPLRIAVVGCGWYGSGIVRELFRLPNIVPKILISHSEEKCADVYLSAGLGKGRIAVAPRGESVIDLRGPDRCFVSSDISVIRRLKGLDLVFEATGDVVAGTRAALYAIGSGVPFVTVNSEMDATVGLRLAALAGEKGLVYSNSDGDQPGCLARLIEDISLYGFIPKVAGNCKGFLDRHQTPEKVMPFVPKGQNPVAICSFADGSKQSLELAVTGNAFGYYPFRRGMLGPAARKEDFVKTFDGLIDFKSSKETYVDYVMHVQGPEEGIGVFVIACRSGAQIQLDMEYLRMGKGPYYLFFKDYHLCYFEGISTILETALSGRPTIVPAGRFIDVVAFAKRGLAAGRILDGVGGYDLYGEVERASVVANEKFLPLGIAKGARVLKDIPADCPLTYDTVELPDNEAVKARLELERIGFPGSDTGPAIKPGTVL